MQTNPSSIYEALQSFQPIALDGLNQVALMNRVDKKYIGSVASLVPLLQTLSTTHLVLDIEQRRQFKYDNLYFDTPERTMYHDHHRGKLNRHKVRRRLYVDSGVAFLEVKSKSNKGRTIKKRREALDLLSPFNEEEAAFLSRESTFEAAQLEPTLRTAFDRISLVNQALTQRITIDTSISFGLDGKRSTVPDLLIVEVKWSKNLPISIHPTLHAHDLMPSAFSKYTFGMAIHSSDVKKNLMQKRIRRIHAITPIEHIL